MRTSETWDVVILGAGAAGLAAAGRLSGAGASVVVVEARDRIGGRIHTVRDVGWGLPVELGAEFVHGRPKSTWGVLRGMRGLPPYDVTDNHHYLRRGRLVNKDFWSEIEGVLAKLERLGKGDVSFEAFLKRWAKSVPPGAREMATAFVEGFNAADRRLVSAQFLRRAQAAGEEIDELKAYRLPGGQREIVARLAESLDPGRATIHLSTVVDSVRWSEGGVEVAATGASGERRVYRGRAAVVTVPLAVLQREAGSPGAIRFEPGLPQRHMEALRQMKMGPAVKVVARFAEAFWEGRRGLEDLAYFHAPGEAFPTCWTALPMRAPVLTGWAGGPAAEGLTGRPRERVMEAFVGTVSACLGVPRRRVASMVESSYVYDWRADPAAGGAYSYALVGGADAPRVLARPVSGGLYLAGEHTHPRETGTVASAIETGERAARQALTTLGRG